MEDFLGLQLSKQRSSARQMCISSPRSFLITFPACVCFLLTINYHFYHFLFFFFSTFMVSFFVYSWFQLSLFTYLLFSHLDLPPSLFTGLIQNPSLFCISAQPSPMWGFDCSSAYSNTEHHFMEKRSFQASLHSLAMMWFIVSSVWFYHTLLRSLSHVFWRMLTSFWKLLDVSKRKKKKQSNIW